MATYKLIQDVEADDKLLGPLSFRQFIYALVAVFLLYISYLLYSHHGEVLLIITLPIALFSGFLAYPFGKDQPTEVWALAKFRFFIKPRRRIWAQSGVKELVTITVPKKVEVQRTNGLSQTEVKSRLQVLANTIDSRGWVIKNVSNVYQNPLTTDGDSDRLISANALTQDVPEYDIPDSEDPYNEASSPIAKQVDQLLSANNSKHHQELIDHLNAIRTTQASFTAPAPIVQGTVVGTPTNLPPENEIEKQLKDAYATSHASLNNMHAIRKVPPVLQTEASPEPTKPKSTPILNPVIMNLSQRNDLNINVVKNEADRAIAKETGSDEVLISLH